ncbi:hypothetical protein Tco_1051539 [Tanacetum coccineum]
MNVKNCSNSTTPIIDKIGKFKDLLISGQDILVDEAGNPLKKVECPGDYDSKDEVASVDNDMARSMASERVCFGTQRLLKQWRDSYGNGDYDEDPYNDDMYEGHDLPQEIQAICDNLDIREGETIDAFMTKLTALASKARSLAYELEEVDLTKRLPHSMLKSFLQIVASIKQCFELDSMLFDEAVGRLNAYEDQSV